MMGSGDRCCCSWSSSSPRRFGVWRQAEGKSSARPPVLSLPTSCQSAHFDQVVCHVSFYSQASCGARKQSKQQRTPKRDPCRLLARQFMLNNVAGGLIRNFLPLRSRERTPSHSSRRDKNRNNAAPHSRVLTLQPDGARLQFFMNTPPSPPPPTPPSLPPPAM